MCVCMRVSTNLPAVWRESLRASVEGVNASGKSSESATSGNSGHDAPRDARKERPCLRVELVCQTDTKAHDPFWDGPRLSPAFVTQLLGQVMAPERNIAPRRVYGDRRASEALIFDTRA
jgi:hypothetical protein